MLVVRPVGIDTAATTRTHASGPTTLRTLESWEEDLPQLKR